MAQRTDIRQNLKKAHLTGEFAIVAKFGGHALRHLASRLANVVRQGGRPSFSDFKKKTVFKLLKLLHSFMHYIWV